MSDLSVPTYRYDVREAKSPRDVLEAAHLNYRVATVPLYADVAAGAVDGTPAKMVAVKTGHQAVIRTDTGATLGVVGRAYTPIQTVDFLDALAPVVKEHRLRFVSALTVNYGAMVVVELQLPEPIVVKYQGMEDVLLRRVLYKNSYDGSSQLTLLDYLLRQWCKNGATHVLGMAGESVRHTSGSAIRVPLLIKGVSQASARFQLVGEKINKYAKLPFSVEQMERLAEVLMPSAAEVLSFPTYQKRQDLKRRFATEASGTFGKTAWDALNAVSEYTNHGRVYRPGPGGVTLEVQRYKAVLLHENDMVDRAEDFIDAEYRVVAQA